MAKLTISYGVAQIMMPAITGYLITLFGTYTSTLLITAAFMGGRSCAFENTGTSGETRH